MTFVKTIQMKKQTFGYGLLALLALISLTYIAISAPLLQDEDYHHFSDTKTICGIPNFWNVISNFPFLIIGMIGIYRTNGSDNLYYPRVSFFAGIIFVALGSAFYHYDPNSRSLLLDRLPMTIAFMSLCALLVGEFINKKAGKILLIPFILCGIASILYWILSGDLRLYALVQFYPMLAIPVVLLFFSNRAAQGKHYWFLLVAYVIAKLCEHFDQQIHEAIGIISGHSLKHIIAAIGILNVAMTGKKTGRVVPPEPISS